MRIFILGSYGPSLTNFRGDMIKEMINKGHEVFACAPDDEGNTRIEVEKLGAKYVPIIMRRTGMNPFSDFVLIKELVRIIKSINPDVFLSYTIKPNIYGSIAAHLSGVKNIYSMMTGAGSVLRGTSFKFKVINKLLVPLYAFAFSKNKSILFLNEDDVNLFRELKIINKQKTIVIGSSGVNLDYFTKKSFQNYDTFLFIARLIKDKGIYEFLEATKIAKLVRPSMRFAVLGPFDSNPTAISPNELKDWVESGIVEYYGATDDVRPYIEKSFVVVLPSYHEGQGRVLVEAMSMGRATIASDVSGCRQTVINGVTGYLIPPKDAKELAEKMIYMFDNKEETVKMGEDGYRRAVETFDVVKINNRILREMNLNSVTKHEDDYRFIRKNY